MAGRVIGHWSLVIGHWKFDFGLAGEGHVCHPMSICANGRVNSHLGNYILGAAIFFNIQWIANIKILKITTTKSIATKNKLK